MRTSSAWLLAALAACSGGGGESERQGPTIACALAGAAEFTQECWVERAERDGERILVIHHPDGGFRRLVLREGGGLAAADGADEPEVAVVGDIAEITLAGSRYRLPLRTGPDGNE